MLRDFFATVTRTAIGLTGTVLATVSGVLIALFIVLELIGFHSGPYLGILTFLILPMVLILGLILIPLGYLLARRWARRAAAAGEQAASSPVLPVIDLNKPRTRNVMVVTAMLTVANVVLISAATYKGVEVMDSTAFCGTACHSVMQPEFTAHQRSSHARVDCVDCHIGPGADWFVKSKISGAWQLVAVTFDLYPKPIPTPVHDLRPARDTCEQCHWPEKFVGEKLVVKTHFDEDEGNTELKTALLLKVGGADGNRSHGIHWHVDPANRIRYQASDDRETIYDVELTRPDGSVTVFSHKPAPEGTPWRTMDCVDCHNRPTHVYRQPEREVDEALDSGRIDVALPYIKRQALEVLRTDYASHEQARSGIADAVRAFYADEYPQVADERRSSIEQAAAELGEIYALNVFPSMNVTWDTYPDHIGHETSPGCFRCHDRKHRTADRERISKDCELCHTVLAEGEQDPEILELLLP